MEIALLLGIVGAATKNLNNSGLFVVLGLVIGVFCASLFAFFAKSVSISFNGLGDEVLDSFIILVTVAAIIWTIVWIRDYGKKVTKNLRQVSEGIKAGEKNLAILSFVVAVTVFREGVEIIFYIYSIASAKKIEVDSYLSGAILGAGGGVALGIFIYRGLAHFAEKYILKISSFLLALTAAGLASEAAGILSSSGLVEVFSGEAWDSSAFISASSLTGKFLKTVAGYDPKPRVLQLLFYFGTLWLAAFLVWAKTFIGDFGRFGSKKK